MLRRHPDSAALSSGLRSQREVGLLWRPRRSGFPGHGALICATLTRVARMERSEIRGRSFPTRRPTRITLALHPGYASPNTEGKRHHESLRRHRGNPAPGGSRDHHRLSGQPHPRARRRGRHPPDHRAPGAHRPAHGRRDVARDLGPQARRVRDAARARHRERLWRRRAGVERVGADPRDAGRLCAPARLGRAQLQFQRPDARHHQVGRAGHVGQGAVRDHAPRLHAAALRARRAGAGRGAERCVERGGRSVRLRRLAAAALGPRSGRDPRSREDAARRQAPGALRRPGRALGGSVGRAETARRAARHSGHHLTAGQERVSRNASALARLRRPRDPGAGASFPERERSHPRHRLLVHADEFRRHRCRPARRSSTRRSIRPT